MVMADQVKSVAVNGAGVMGKLDGAEVRRANTEYPNKHFTRGDRGRRRYRDGVSF